MKKLIFSFAALSFLVACGGSGEKKQGDTKETTTTTTTETPAVKDITQDPAYQKGLSLIAKSDCLTCHKWMNR